MMQLPKTSLNIVYVKPSIAISQEEADKKLTKLMTLISQVGFKEVALNNEKAAEYAICLK